MSDPITPAAGTAAPPAVAPAAPVESAPNLGEAAPPAVAPNLGTEAPNAPATETAPAKFEVKLPEGLDKDGFFSGYEDLAKELGLDSEKAQKIADRYGAASVAAREAFQAQASEQFAAWGAALQSDKELGGAKFKESFEVARRGLDHVGSPELKKLLVETGLGGHPDVVRAFYRVGQALSEDSSAGRRSDANGGQPAHLTTDEALARQMYPGLYKKE